VLFPENNSPDVPRWYRGHQRRRYRLLPSQVQPVRGLGLLKLGLGNRSRVGRVLRLRSEEGWRLLRWERQGSLHHRQPPAYRYSSHGVWWVELVGFFGALVCSSLYPKGNFNRARSATDAAPAVDLKSCSCNTACERKSMLRGRRAQLCVDFSAVRGWGSLQVQQARISQFRSMPASPAHAQVNRPRRRLPRGQHQHPARTRGSLLSSLDWSRPKDSTAVGRDLDTPTPRRGTMGGWVGAFVFQGLDEFGGVRGREEDVDARCARGWKGLCFDEAPSNGPFQTGS